MSTKGSGRYDLRNCPYGKTADRKPELETCVKKEEAFGSHRRAAMMMLESSRLLVGRK